MCELGAMKELIAYLDSTSTKKADLARVLNTSRGYITDLANGRRKPGRDMAIAIERATDGRVPVSTWSDSAA